MLFADPFLFLNNLARLLQRTEIICLSLLLTGFIVVFLFFIQSGTAIFDPP